MKIGKYKNMFIVTHLDANMFFCGESLELQYGYYYNRDIKKVLCRNSTKSLRSTKECK